MKSRQLSKRLLVLIILLCCYQKIWAGAVVKGTRAKRNSTLNAQATQTTKPPRMLHKLKTTTTTTTTTATPELETTILPEDFDLDGRSAFINNKFVAEAGESTSYTPPPTHDSLQPHIQTLQTNTDDNYQHYDNTAPHIKETLDNDHIETQKIPNKPINSYDISRFDEYEEEETSESDYIPENCEDTQESLEDNNESNGNVAAAEYILKQENLGSSEPNIFEQSFQNKPHDSSNNGPQINIIQGISYDHNHQNKLSEANTNQGLLYNPLQYGYETTKTIQQHNYNNNNSDIKQGIKPKAPNQFHTHHSYYGPTNRNEQQHLQPQLGLHNQHVQTNPLEHYGHTNKNSYDQPKSQQYHKHTYNVEKPLEPLLNYQKPTQISRLRTKQQTKLNYNKPENSFYNKRLHNGTSSNYYNNHTELLSASGNSNFLNPTLMPNFSYGNSNTETSSPFSSSSGHNKKFKTVSSSIQYVSTPFADLVFKYSIGMAKHTNSKLPNTDTDKKSHIYNVPNDIERKTE